MSTNANLNTFLSGYGSLKAKSPTNFSSATSSLSSSVQKSLAAKTHAAAQYAKAQTASMFSATSSATFTAPKPLLQTVSQQPNSNLIIQTTVHQTIFQQPSAPLSLPQLNVVPLPQPAMHTTMQQTIYPQPPQMRTATTALLPQPSSPPFIPHKDIFTCPPSPPASSTTAAAQPIAINRATIVSAIIQESQKRMKQGVVAFQRKDTRQFIKHFSDGALLLHAALDGHDEDLFAVLNCVPLPNFQLTPREETALMHALMHLRMTQKQYDPSAPTFEENDPSSQ